MTPKNDTDISEVKKFQLSMGQKALWFLHKLYPQSPVYNICRAVEINTDLNYDLFKKTFKLIAERHEILRTIFRYENSTNYQIVKSKIDIDIKIFDVVNEDDDFIDDQMYVQSIIPFDLEKAPLFRISIFTKSPTQHIVLFIFHHIIADLWSLAILIKEWGIIYDAYVDNKNPELPLPSFEYSEYVYDETRYLESENASRMLNFWKHYLKGELPILTFKSHRANGGGDSYLGGSVSLRVGVNQTVELKKLSKKLGTNIFTFLLTTFHILLYKFTSQPEIIIGTSKSGRRRNSIGTVGYFVNSIPIRAKLNPEMIFNDFLDIVNKTIVETSKNDRYPFSLLVENIQPIRDTNKTPVYQTFFTMQKTTRMGNGDGLSFLSIGESGGEMLWGRNPVVTKGLKHRIVPFDLTLLVSETNDDLLVSIQYNSTTFSKEFSQQMVNSYICLLHDIIENPYRMIKNLNVLRSEEIKNMLSSQSLLAPSEYSENTVIDLFEDQVNKSHESAAIMYNDQIISYGELNLRANKLAKDLIDLGVGPEKKVGVYLKRSPKILISILAIFKAGGVYVPIDSSNPQERLEYITEDAQICLLLSEGQINLKKSLSGVIQINPDKYLDEDVSISDQNPVRKISSLNTAYVIYTSGSTGLPKGVPISNFSLANHIKSMTSEFEITSDDRILQFTSINFDASIEQILLAFTNGASLFQRGEELWSTEEFVEIIKKYNLTVMNIPPAYWTQIANEAKTYSSIIVAQKVRLIIVGGDKIQFDILKSWQQTELKSIKFLNAYGPTETTITSTLFDTPPDFCNQSAGKNIPIGKSIKGNKVLILDDHGNLMPEGVVGEIYIGGNTLSTGYLNRPDLTAEYFIPDPFSNIPGERLYKTGDLASYTNRGELEFYGRKDNQIKLRGIRIELEEIESVVMQHPEISIAAVTVEQSNKGEKNLVCYYVPKSEQVLDRFEIQEFLSERIPKYMIPSVFVVLKEMPVTSIGKIDRKSLPKSSISSDKLKTPYAAPRTSVEEKVSCIVAEVLQLDRVGIYDNFFELGGHSILAIQFVSKIKKEFGINLPLGFIFENPDVASLSNEIVQILASAFEEDNLEGLLTLVE